LYFYETSQIQSKLGNGGGIPPSKERGARPKTRNNSSETEAAVASIAGRGSQTPPGLSGAGLAPRRLEKAHEDGRNVARPESPIGSGTSNLFGVSFIAELIVELHEIGSCQLVVIRLELKFILIYFNSLVFSGCFLSNQLILFEFRLEIRRIH
jgi:hypothetical protein